MNQQFHAYPTVRAVFGLPVSGQLDLTQVPSTATLGPSGPGPVSSSWVPPPGLPDAGALSTATIPATVSGFAARDAWVYLPPAYLSTPRALLPVLVLLGGQPGSPRDWVDGGQLARTMNAYARDHGGLAPVVVVPDSLGGVLGQPLCVDSSAGRAATYLTIDVPAWIRRTVQVDPDPRHWAVAGSSAGGTCALQLAVTAPEVYPTFVDISGEAEPTLGDRARTIAERFGGDPAAFARANPVDVMTTHPLPGTAGLLVVGRDDSSYRPQAEAVARAARAAGIDVGYLELPGGHSWQVWSAALAATVPFLATRTGLTP